ncbi:MAG: DUF1501 domain-containing protein [Pseudomonadota bacterium]|nr:DUF1501 domain-containing protein [Pseudomonadota bacterium]
MRRRQFLGSLGALVGGAMLARPARAGVGTDPGAATRKFLFVGAQGGWDPTRVFQPVFDLAGADLEAGAEPGNAHGLPYVAHPGRPSVSAFFDTWAPRSVILNGVLVPSIAHDICRMLILTGSVSGLRPDWPAIIGSEGGARILPHVVLAGPSFPGDRGTAVARTGSFGQLESLLSGTALATSDLPTRAPVAPAESVLDRWVGRRTAAWAAGARSPGAAQLGADLEASLERATALKELKWIVDFSGGADLASQAAVAVDVLARGVSRCVSLDSGGSALAWDTHAENDPIQGPLFEDLFYGLNQLMQMLALTPGEAAPTLLEETTVVVYSEMGRTAQLNSADGKDHWPYTSVLLVGAGVSGGRVVGGLDSNFYGRPVDPVSGDLAAGGVVPDVEGLGATLLTLAGVDPAEFVAAEAIGGV